MRDKKLSSDFKFQIRQHNHELEVVGQFVAIMGIFEFFAVKLRELRSAGYLNHALFSEETFLGVC